MRKLPDNILCRRHLIRQRLYRKQNMNHTTLSTSIFKIYKRTLSSIVDITYNARTDKVSLSYDFIYKNKRMLSKQKPKVQCNTETGRRFVQEHRKNVANYNKHAIKCKQITNPILKVDDNLLSLYTYLSCNVITHTVRIDIFYGYRGKRIELL